MPASSPVPHVIFLAISLPRDYIAQAELYGLEGRPMGSNGACSNGGGVKDYEGVDRHHGPQWVLLRFDQPVTAPRVS